jgi:serine/threonine-protein kinase
LLGKELVESFDEGFGGESRSARAGDELADDLVELPLPLGIVRLDYDRDREGAQREFLRALQLNPGSGYAHHWYAHSLEAQGRLEEAMKEMRTELDLDPLSIPVNWDIAGELIEAGRYDDALEHLRKAAELFPNVPLFSYMKVQAYWRKGDRAAARGAIHDLIATEPKLADDPIFLALVGVQAVIEGRRADAVHILDSFEDLRDKQYVDGFLPLPLTLALGDREKTELWLQRAADERSTLFVYLPVMKDYFGIDPAILQNVH